MDISPDVLNQIIAQIADLRSFQLQSTQALGDIDGQIIAAVQDAIAGLTTTVTNQEAQIQFLITTIQSLITTVQSLGQQVQALNTWALTVIPPGP